MTPTAETKQTGVGEDHREIWLEPMARNYGCEGRLWSYDNPWDDSAGAPRYVRADIVDGLLAACRCALGYLTGNMDGDMDLGDPVEMLRAALSKAASP